MTPHSQTDYRIGFKTSSYDDSKDPNNTESTESAKSPLCHAITFWGILLGFLPREKKKKKTKRFCKVPAAESEQALQVTSVTLTPARWVCHMERKESVPMN